MFTDVEDKLFAKEYEPKLEYPKERELEPDYIFDENLSVEENSDLVLEYNLRIEAKIEAYREAEYMLNEEFYFDMISVLVDKYSFSEKVAWLIYSRVYSESPNRSKQELINDVKDFADFIQTILND